MIGTDLASQLGIAFAHGLFDGVWIGALVALVVHVLLRGRRDLNAASRHAAWYVALVVIAVLPAVSLVSSLARTQVTAAPAQHTVRYGVTSGSQPSQAASHASPQAASSVPAAVAALRSAHVLLDTPLARDAAVAAGIVAATVASVRIAALVLGLIGLARVKRASRVIDVSIAPTVARSIARDP